MDTHRSWIFPRDPAFAEKAGPVLDLYHRRWQGEPLRPRDFVLSADEKTQTPIRSRRHPVEPPVPRRTTGATASAYATARRVFWVVDNGTIHRGQRAVERLRARWPNLILVHLSVHASWLNQIEIYFSILQRKALTPADFSSRQALAERILGFQAHYQTVARPFEWRFTRRDLARQLCRCAIPHDASHAA